MKTIQVLILGAFALWIAPDGATAEADDTPTGSPPATATKVATVEGITEYLLDNGLRFLLFPDRSQQQITVNISYLVGSRHEGYGETGMAHLLEHLVFKGTPNHPGIPNELTERGASYNATTWFDLTSYYETFPADEDNLAWALDLEADRMVNSYISAEDLGSEMTVVRNEWERGENSPSGILKERVLSTAFLWHNYGNTTIGARTDIENVPIERLQAFYRKYYQPDNAVLVVAGRFDPRRAVDIIKEKFGVIPRPERTGANQLFTTYTAEPTQDGERTVTLRRVGDVQYAIAAYHVPSGSHEQFAAVEVLAHLLGTQPAGRLYKNVVETGLAAETWISTYRLKEPGVLLAGAQVRRKGDLSEAVEAMLATLQGLADEPPTAEEVDRAKTEFAAAFERAFNHSGVIGGNLGQWASMGDWRLMFLHRDRWAEVTPADVLAVAKAYLQTSNRTVGYFYSTDEAPPRAEIPTPPDVAALISGYTGGKAVAQGEAVRTDAREHREPHHKAHPRGHRRGGALAEGEPGRCCERQLLVPAWHGERPDGPEHGGTVCRSHADVRHHPAIAAGAHRRGVSPQGQNQPERRLGLRQRLRDHSAREPARRVAPYRRDAAPAGLRPGGV